MENEKEVLDTHTEPEETTPQVEEITLSKAELEDLKHKAQVSSQNFERAKKAEARLKELEANSQIDIIGDQHDYDDDKFSKVQSELSEMKKKLEKTEIIELHPKIKEVWTEFETYLTESENLGMPMKTAAKAFMVEKGLLTPQRKGLEKPTGGTKGPMTTGLSSEDIKRIRETDQRKYRDMLKKGQIKFS